MASGRRPRNRRDEVVNGGWSMQQVSPNRSSRQLRPPAAPARHRPSALAAAAVGDDHAESPPVATCSDCTKFKGACLFRVSTQDENLNVASGSSAACLGYRLPSIALFMMAFNSVPG